MMHIAKDWIGDVKFRFDIVLWIDAEKGASKAESSTKLIPRARPLSESCSAWSICP